MISRFEKFKLNESEITPPNIPNTMNFWHGGNLDYYDDIISQKNGRYEYGPGLYIATDYGTAKKYAKGSRKLYLLTVENGVDINYAFFDVDKVKEFIDFYVIVSLKKIILNRIEKYIKNDKVPGYIFNNIILNEKAISYNVYINIDSDNEKTIDKYEEMIANIKHLITYNTTEKSTPEIFCNNDTCQIL